VSPALDLSLISVLRESLEIFRGQLSGCGTLSGELLADETVGRRS
jgi:hypothetical protein